MHNRWFRAVSSVYGKIEQVMFVYPGNDTDRAQLLKLYQEAYRLIPNRVEFYVFAVVGSQQDTERSLDEIVEEIRRYFAEATNSNLRESRVQTIILGTVQELRGTVREWVQDLFFVLESESRVPVFLQQVHFRHQHDVGYSNTQIAETFASATDFLVKPFPYFLTGGNILVGDTYMIASKAILIRNKCQYEKSEAEITEAFRCGFGVENLIWINALDVANGSLLGHIDMFMNLGGKVYEDYSWKELVFLGEIRDDCVDKRLDVASPEIVSCKKQLNDIASHLERYCSDGLRFKVERIPLLLHFKRGRSPEMVVRSYNNCLVEVYGRVRNVYLPRYREQLEQFQAGGTAIEQELVKIYERYGFTASFIDGNFDTLSDNQGSFRCISKVLKRSHTEVRGWNFDFSHNRLRFNGNDQGIARQYQEKIEEVLAAFRKEREAK